MAAWLLAAAILLQQPVHDAVLAARIAQLFHAITTLDDGDPQVKAGEAEIRQLFSTRGLPTIEAVGDEASYQFLALLCSTGPTNTRTRVLSAGRAALAKKSVPADAVEFCAARIRQNELKARARRRAPTNPALAATIGQLFARDQAVRQQQGFDRDKMIRTDEELRGPLADILDRHGVPNYSTVGVDATTQFVVLIQHQPPEFRRKALPQLKAHVDAGQADAGDYAMMYDRAQRDEGRNQLYGMNLECDQTTPELHETPIENESRVNERLARLGLMRMELYSRLVLEMSPPICGTGK